MPDNEQEEIKNPQEEYYNDYWRNQKKTLFTALINTLLILTNIGVFLWTSGADHDVIFEKYSLIVSFVQDGEYYRLISSAFLHFNLEHIASNMIILFFMGSIVEKDLGHICYLLMYTVSIVAGNLLSMAWDQHTGAVTMSAGASGAVFGIIGAVVVIILSGRKQVKKGSSLYIRLAVLVCYSLYSGFAMKDINNAAHIGGFIGGLVVTLLVTIIGHKQYDMEDWI